MAVDAAGVWMRGQRHRPALARAARRAVDRSRSRSTPAARRLAVTPRRAVWVANARDGRFTRVDPATNTMGRSLRVDGMPRRAGSRRRHGIWATVRRERRGRAGALPPRPVRRADRRRSRAAGRGDSSPTRRCGPGRDCRRCRYATRRCRRMPGGRVPGGRPARRLRRPATTRPLDRGIFDADKLHRQRAPLRRDRVAWCGEIGPVQLRLRTAQIPIANGAEGSPLAMVSPTASLPSLTKGARRRPAGALPEGYPELRAALPGRRRPGRCAGPRGPSAGRASGRGRLGRRFGRAGRGSFAAKAPAWASTSRGSMPLYARRRSVSRRGGCRTRLTPTSCSSRSSSMPAWASSWPRSGPGSGRTCRCSRSTAPLPVSALFATAGDAARDVRIAVPGMALERVGATGQRFASQFAATHGGRPANFTALYAAAATEVLLAAIERSDGTRAGVAKALLATRVDSVLGPIRVSPTATSCLPR